MMEILKAIKDMDMVSILGLITGNMKDIGKMVSSMVRDRLHFQMVKSRLEFGRMESG